MHLKRFKRGFLPSNDPASYFSHFTELNSVNAWGQQLPQLLLEDDFREQAQRWLIPFWPEDKIVPQHYSELRLYYMRLAFIASGYINQVGQTVSKRLPANIAQPLIQVSKLLSRPPILSYDGYALYNWYRLDPSKPIELGNIDTLQNFVELYDEHWFILVHVAIEALSSEMIYKMVKLDPDNVEQVNTTLACIDETLKQQHGILKRIPEHMSADLYFSHFRPYIGFFDDVVYEGKNSLRGSYRGETGAQSSILPMLTAFLKIPHQETELTQHLNDMCDYMPKAHRELVQYFDSLPEIKSKASINLFNRVLEHIAQFREQHFEWAKSYINQKTPDATGTGGTPYYKWLNQLIRETRQYKIKPQPIKLNTLEFMVGNICELDVQAIVRPAHKNIYKGRGVSVEIFERAGPELLKACEKIGRAKQGEAVITPAFNLPCDAVIHVVPPHWDGGDHWACQSLKELSNCYENAIALALKNNITTLAFVSVGTGGNQFPHAMAAHQALEVLVRHQHKFHKLIICLSNKNSHGIWVKAYQDFQYRLNLKKSA